MARTIEFSEEQTMLLETAMDFCANQSPIEKVRTQLEEEAGFDKDQWSAMVELGWLGIIIPEELGGLGLGMADVVPIVEAMGKYLMGSPFLSTTLASHALIRGSSEAQKSEWLPGIAAGSVATLALQEQDGNWDLTSPGCTAMVEGGELKLSGSKTFVLDAHRAEVVIVSVMLDGSATLLCLDRKLIEDDRIRREVVIDETRRSFRLDLDGLLVPKSACFDNHCLGDIESAALLLYAAEMCGGQTGVLHVIVEYLNTRKAFDRYIGSFQALKHPCADMLMGIESSRSHLYRAATLFDTDDAEREESIRMANAVASEAFAYAGDRAVQFHGGFGFTFECHAQLFLRRALFGQYQFGDENHQRQKLAALLFDS